jgi:hypothetical protein
VRTLTTTIYAFSCGQRYFMQLRSSVLALMDLDSLHAPVRTAYFTLRSTAALACSQRFGPSPSFFAVLPNLPRCYLHLLYKHQAIAFGLPFYHRLSGVWCRNHSFL